MVRSIIAFFLFMLTALVPFCVYAEAIDGGIVRVTPLFGGEENSPHLAQIPSGLPSDLHPHYWPAQSRSPYALPDLYPEILLHKARRDRRRGRSWIRLPPIRHWYSLGRSSGDPLVERQLLRIHDNHSNPAITGIDPGDGGIATARPLPTSEREGDSVRVKKAVLRFQKMGVPSTHGSGLPETPNAASDLLSIYGLALENDAEYWGAIDANRAARELRPQARAHLLPNVELNLSAAENDRDIREGGLYRVTGQAGFTSEEMKLTITQPIYRKDLWVRLDQAGSQVEQADLNLILARQKLMLRAAERYFEVLRARDGLAFAQAEKRATDKQLQQVRRQFESGLIGITDVEEARAGYDLAMAREIEAGIQLANAHEALRQITGEYAPGLQSLGARMRPVSPEPNDIDQWTEAALTQNVELAAARRAVEIAKAEIKRVGAGHLPTLDLVGTHYRNANSADQYGASDTRGSSITLQFRLPIYQGGLVLSRSREAIHRHSQAMDKMVETGRAVQRKTRDGFWRVLSGISRIDALKQVLQSTETALKAVRKGFQVGTRTSVDVLDSQREMFRAKKHYADARYDYILDILNLRQAAGVLSREDLVMVNTWLG